MGLEFINKLPTPAEIREQFPIPAELAALKEKRDAEIRKIMIGLCILCNNAIASAAPAP